MELKKSPKADLENKRKIFLEFGLVISILICLYGFESNSKLKEAETLGILNSQPTEEIYIPITKQEEVKPLLPPPPKVVDLILIVDDNIDTKGDFIFDETEVTDNTAIHAVMNAPGKTEIDDDSEKVFLIPEEMPEFPGGNLALLNFLNQSVKYPVIAQETGIYGKVTINFVVNKDGTISDARILRGVDQSLDKEALRVVNSMPRWKPGKQAGKNVRVSFSVPINFVLQ